MFNILVYDVRLFLIMYVLYITSKEHRKEGETGSSTKLKFHIFIFNI